MISSDEIKQDEIKDITPAELREVFESVDPKSALQLKINEILMKHKQIESDISMNHEYWGLCNQLRGMR